MILTEQPGLYLWFSSHCLRAAAFYIRGLLSFFQGRYNEAKYDKIINRLMQAHLRVRLAFIHIYALLCCRRFLRETLKMSNAEDLNRLTACSLVLLGHIFYVLGNHRVRLNAWDFNQNFAFNSILCSVIWPTNRVFIAGVITTTAEHFFLILFNCQITSQDKMFRLSSLFLFTLLLCN